MYTIMERGYPYDKDLVFDGVDDLDLFESECEAVHFIEDFLDIRRYYSRYVSQEELDMRQRRYAMMMTGQEMGWE